MDKKTSWLHIKCWHWYWIGPTHQEKLQLATAIFVKNLLKNIFNEIDINEIDFELHER